MNELQIFNYHDNPIRTIERDGEVWWVLKDVCQVLGIERTDSAARRLDSDEKDTHLVSTPSGTQKMVIINEPGLYNVIIRSDKPDAKDFKRWVTHEVLPAIRRTGRYSMNETPVHKLSSLPDGVSLNGLARLISVTRRVMLDMGSNPFEIGKVVKGMFDTCGIELDPVFSKQIPGQLSLFDRPGLDGVQ